MKNRKLFKPKGFSLIELLAAVTMGAVIIGILVVFYAQERKHQVIIEGRSEALQSAESMLRIASRELRAVPGISSDFQNTDLFKIIKIHYNSSGNDSFCYYADVYPEASYGNNSLDTAQETFGLIYDAASNNIYNMRYSAGVFTYNTLITGVEDFDIIPYDDTGGIVTDTANQADIVYVDLIIKTFNERGAMSRADTINYSRRVTIRSRM